MHTDGTLKTLGSQDPGRAMLDFIAELYPICRSITGEGVRETLRLIQKRIPLEMYEVPSGTNVFDWTVPLEWNVSDAYIKNAGWSACGRFQGQQSTRHELQLTTEKRMTLEELNPHLFSLPDHPEWIPYRTSYYQENWGFCLSHKESRVADK